MLSAAYVEENKANDVLSLALDLLQARGAEYADARFGICKIEGHGNDFQPLELFNDAYLGLRFQIGDQSRNVVLRKFGPEELPAQINALLESPVQTRKHPELWTSAAFEQGKHIAFKSTDSTLATQWQVSALRFATPTALPAPGDGFLFCDLLLDY